MARPGIEPRTSDLRVRCHTDGIFVVYYFTAVVLYVLLRCKFVLVTFILYYFSYTDLTLYIIFLFDVSDSMNFPKMRLCLVPLHDVSYDALWLYVSFTVKSTSIRYRDMSDFEFRLRKRETGRDSFFLFWIELFSEIVTLKSMVRSGPFT